MHVRYLTIDEAAALKGVTPRDVHEALCRGELSPVLVYRSDLTDPRLLDRWDLEYWRPTAAAA
ncbi:MAG TPA: hypothetical protein VGM37_15325 [Armatimonadota bacterium]|jgi:hypothetical protein